MANVTKSSVSEKLAAALSMVDRPHTFCTSGKAPAVLPGLDVSGMGPIALPLTAPQAKELKKHCEQAPYGKGEETLVDPQVRRVWRLPPDRFALANPSWTGCLQKMVAQVQAKLGLEQQSLAPHLYELLLYEKGSFFLPHRDGEKLDRMVATLVIVLPSIHDGGELIVRHEGQEVKIDHAGKDAQFHTHFAAFYSDCEHEVLPLRSGYRLCLVYNLTLAASKAPVGAPRSREHVEQIAAILGEWSKAAAPEKLAVLLAHRYTQGGLSWDALKGVDRAQAQILAAAAKLADCQAHLALLTLWESGSAEPADYSPRSRRGRRNNDEEYAAAHEMGEIYDRSLTAAHWSTPDGSRPRFGAIPVDENEVVPEKGLKAIEPKEDFEGYTGNAGMTLERWYRHAAIFLWPSDRHFKILCEGGSQQAVPALTRMVSVWLKAEGSEAAAQKKQCLQFAKMILAKWPENPYQGYGRADKTAAQRDPLVALERLGEPALIRTYFNGALLKDASLEPGNSTVKAVLRHGWGTFRDDLVQLFEATTAATIERNVRMLERLCLAKFRGLSKGEQAEAAKTCLLLAETLLAALARIDTVPAESDWRMRRVERAMLIARLGRALLAAELDDLLRQLVLHALGRPDLYSLRNVHIAALAKLGPWSKGHLQRRSPALATWIAKCQDELQLLTVREPQPPTDFRRADNITCKCSDCAELKRFLHDRGEQTHSFQMAQQRRDHLENNIRSAHADLDCTTNKRPRPQILICTKNIASHERELIEFQENLDQAAALRSLAAALPQ